LSPVTLLIRHKKEGKKKERGTPTCPPLFGKKGKERGPSLSFLRKRKKLPPSHATKKKRKRKKSMRRTVFRY